MDFFQRWTRFARDLMDGRTDGRACICARAYCLALLTIAIIQRRPEIKPTGLFNYFQLSIGLSILRTLDSTQRQWELNSTRLNSAFAILIRLAY